MSYKEWLPIECPGLVVESEMRQADAWLDGHNNSRMVGLQVSRSQLLGKHEEYVDVSGSQFDRDDRKLWKWKRVTTWESEVVRLGERWG